MLNEGQVPVEGESRKPTTVDRLSRLKRYVAAFRDQLKHLDSEDEFGEYIQGQTSLAKYMRLNGQFSGKTDNEVLLQFIEHGDAELYEFFTRHPIKEVKEKVDQMIQQKRANGKEVNGGHVEDRHLIAENGNGGSSEEKKLKKTSRFFGVVMFFNFVKDLYENADTPEKFEEYLKGEVSYFQFLKLHGTLGEDPTVRRTFRRAFMAYIKGGHAELYRCFSHQDLETLSKVLGDLIEIRQEIRENVVGERPEEIGVV